MKVDVTDANDVYRQRLSSLATNQIILRAARYGEYGVMFALPGGLDSGVVQIDSAIKDWLDENTPGWSMSADKMFPVITFQSDEDAAVYMLRWR